MPMRRRSRPSRTSSVRWGKPARGCRDVVRTRIYVTDIGQWEAIGRAHGEAFGAIRPATAMVEVSRLIDRDMLVEIEADALAAHSDAAP